MSMLQVTGLNKSFGDVQVLKSVNLTVNAGDVAAILGPSGSGKTTLLRCLNFLEKADSGELTFDGASFRLGHVRRQEIASIRRKTAFVFQNYNLFANKSALQNVTLGLTSVRHVSASEAAKRGTELLDRVGLADQAEKYPIQLSGGQQQRVAIARALASDPEIIYFDEPTSALDPELIGEVLDVMKKLAADGMTMLVVTHEMNFARNVSNRVVFMEGGQILEDASTEGFFAHHQNPRIRDFLRHLDTARD